MFAYVESKSLRLGKASPEQQPVDVIVSTSHKFLDAYQIANAHLPLTSAFICVGSRDEVK
jgi:hypothetical protein